MRVVANAPLPRLIEIYALRRYEKIGSPFEKQSTLERIFTLIHAAGDSGITPPELCHSTGWPPATIERSVMFFLKYDLVRPP